MAVQRIVIPTWMISLEWVECQIVETVKLMIVLYAMELRLVDYFVLNFAVYRPHQINLF
jgi:hypothetical protein